MDEPDIKIVDVFVCKLRKKLAEASGGLDYIETIWGQGYMLRDYDEETEEQTEESNPTFVKEVSE